VKRRSTKNKKKAQPAPIPPQQVDEADTMSYQIGSVIKDKRHRITHVRIGNNIYDTPTLYKLHKDSGYKFYTSDDGVIKRDVLRIEKKSGKYHFATEADWKKENNLDYLPTAQLD